MTTFQKINRRRWPIWARMTLLAVAAAMVVALVLPTIAESGHEGPDPIVSVIEHTGGNASEDCDAAVAENGGAWSYDATAFTNNPGRDEDADIDVISNDDGSDTGWDIQVTDVHRTDFDWVLFDNSPGGVGQVDDQHDEDLVAPEEGKAVSHVSFCLRLEADNTYSVIAVEVKGSKQTNHYFYDVYACDEKQEFSDLYSVTCSGKPSFGAEFTVIDDGTIALITFGDGVAFFVEEVSFVAQPAQTPGPVPFVLKYDDTDPQDGGDAVEAPQCEFNPDTAGGGAADGIVDVEEFLDGTLNPNYAGLALPLLDPAPPAGEDPRHTTCFYDLSFEQLASGWWIPVYTLLNKGDGWRTIY